MTSIAQYRARDEAAAWLARLQRDPLDAGDGADFEAWLAERPENGAAYADALAVWQEYETHAGEVLAELDAPVRRPRAPTRRWLTGAGFAAAAGLALAVIAPTLTPSVQTYATGKAERERVTLADGTVIDLNAETRLSVRLSGGSRAVVLDDGEAIFDVAHDARRPFTVAARGHEVRVLGTQFDVRSRSGELVVTVAQGRVQVTPRAAASGRGHVLGLGQRLEIDGAGGAALSAVDPEEAFGWRAGRLVYRAEPLSEVVADLNRQFTQQITLADAELGAIPITGVIVLDDPHSVAARLSLMLPVRSVASDGGLLLLRK